MKTFNVTIPIAGHISFEIEAENKEEAEAKAWDTDSEEGEVTWDMLNQFNSGNICHCPFPWSVEVEEV